MSCGPACCNSPDTSSWHLPSLPSPRCAVHPGGRAAAADPDRAVWRAVVPHPPPQCQRVGGVRGTGSDHPRSARNPAPRALRPVSWLPALAPSRAAWLPTLAPFRVACCLIPARPCALLPVSLFAAWLLVTPRLPCCCHFSGLGARAAAPLRSPISVPVLHSCAPSLICLLAPGRRCRCIWLLQVQCIRAIALPMPAGCRCRPLASAHHHTYRPARHRFRPLTASGQSGYLARLF